jgi:hypothetical protein
LATLQHHDHNTQTLKKTECALLLELNIIKEGDIPTWRLAEESNGDKESQSAAITEETQDSVFQETQSINTAKEMRSMGHYC